MSADGVPRPLLTCSAYQHASRTCLKSVVLSLANIGAVVAEQPFYVSNAVSVGYANFDESRCWRCSGQKDGTPTSLIDACLCRCRFCPCSSRARFTASGLARRVAATALEIVRWPCRQIYGGKPNMVSLITVFVNHLADR